MELEEKSKDHFEMRFSGTDQAYFGKKERLEASMTSPPTPLVLRFFVILVHKTASWWISFTHEILW